MTAPSPDAAASLGGGATLTIRNLTAHPISLVLAETLPRIPQTNPSSALITFLSSCVGWPTSNPARPAPPPPCTAGADDGYLTSVPLSAVIPPSTSHATTLPAPPSSPNSASSRLRIIFLLGSGPHRFQATLPHHAPRLTPVANLDHAPAVLEALYLPGPACLAILSPASPASWMADLRDELPLSAVSIPGTHNSPTCHLAMPSVRCQAVGVRSQLENGIRFLDVRVSTSRYTPTPTPTPPPHVSSAPISRPSSSQSQSHSRSRSSSRSRSRSRRRASPDISANPHHHHHHHLHPLHLVHGAFSVSLLGGNRLADLLGDIYAFLDAYPSETVILSLKREGLGWGTDADLYRRLREVYCTVRPERWYTRSRIPTLGEARGRIVLLRRFVLDETLAELNDAMARGPPGRRPGSDGLAAELGKELGWGASGDAWPDNAEDGLAGGGHIRVQDFYGVVVRSAIQRKIHAVRVALERAAAQRHAVVKTDRIPDGVGSGLQAEPVTVPSPLFINFLSASNFFNPGCWPERIAMRVNPAILEYLCTCHGEHGKGPNGLEVGDGATGVVVTDWVGVGGDWDLVRCVVALNASLRMGT